MSAPADRPHGMTAADVTRANHLWDGWDDPYGPAANRAFGEPQPSRPTPAMGAPSLGRPDKTGSDK